MIYKIVEFLATAMDTVFFIWFVPKFLHTSVRKERPLLLLFPAILLLFSLVADRFFAGFDFLYIMFFSIGSLAYACFICKKNWAQAVFSVCLYILIIMFGGSIAYSVFSLCISNVEEIMQGMHSINRVIYLVVCKVIQFALLRLALLLFRADSKIDRKNGIFIFLFSISTAVCLGALMTVSSEMDESMQLPVLILLMGLVLTNVAVCFMLYQVQKFQRKEYEWKLFAEKIKDQGARAEDATAIWENIRRVRHDLKNHFTALRGMLQTGDIDACEDYIDKLYPTLNSMGDLVRSDNAVIDYLINTKLASLNGVRTLISGYIDNLSDIAAADLASILGNLLDNAVEAVRKVTDPNRKSIELHFLRKNQNRIILCRNAVEAPVLKSNRELRSTKSEGDHGYGHRIVEALLKKYNGFVEYFEEDLIFSVQIVLPLPENNLFRTKP